MGVEDVKVVINRVRSDMIDKGIMMNMDDCVDMLGVPVLGIVPDDEELMVAALKGTLAVSAENSSNFKYCRKTYGRRSAYYGI